MDVIKGYFGEKDTNWIVPITDRVGNRLDLKKGRIHYARDKLTGEQKAFEVKRLVWAQQSDCPEKIIVLEEIVFSDDGGHGLRLGYYTTSRTGHWWWGQYALMIPREDLEELLIYARDNNMLSIT